MESICLSTASVRSHGLMGVKVLEIDFQSSVTLQKANSANLTMCVPSGSSEQVVRAFYCNYSVGQKHIPNFKHFTK